MLLIGCTVLMQMIFVGNIDATSFQVFVPFSYFTSSTFLTLYNRIMSKTHSLAEISPLHASKALDYLLTKKLSFDEHTEWTQRVFLSRISIAAKSGASIASLKNLFSGTSCVFSICEPSR